jgi:tetratricopeptide (TPR) repeat protein
MSKYLCFFIWIFSFPVFGQLTQKDSALQELKKYKKVDETRLKLYLIVSKSSAFEDPEVGLKYADSANTIAIKLKDKKYLAKVNLIKGLNLYEIRKSDEAIETYKKALKIAEEIQDKELQAFSLHNLAIIYSTHNRELEAIELEKRGYRIFTELKMEPNCINVLNTIGVCYFRLNEYQKALEYYLKSLKIAEKSKDKKLIGNAYENIALVYKRNSQHVKAYEYYEKAIKIYSSINYKQGIINVYTNYGAAKDQNNDLVGALLLYEKGLQIATEIKVDWYKYNLLTNIAIIHNAQKKFDISLPQLKESMDYYISIQDVDSEYVSKMYFVEAILEAPDELLKNENINPTEKFTISLSYMLPILNYTLENQDKETEMYAREILAKIYEKQGNTNLSLKEFKEFVKLKDSLTDFEKKEELLTKEHAYQMDKERILNEAEINRQKIIKYATIGTSSVVLLSGIFLLIGFRKRQVFKEKQKEILFKAQISDTELKALRLQMNPHFIFNSLNSISDYIQKNDSKSADYYLAKFAKLMRGILENSEEKEITVEEELKMLEMYMQLEAMRLNHKFSYEFKIDPKINIRETYIPPLILQPFVENSIWHGLAEKNGEGKIIIEIAEENKMLNCIIEDDGIGRKTKEKSNYKSYGMSITKERLAILNNIKNTNAQVNLIDLDKGTKVEVKLPLEIKPD